MDRSRIHLPPIDTASNHSDSLDTHYGRMMKRCPWTKRCLGPDISYTNQNPPRASHNRPDIAYMPQNVRVQKTQWDMFYKCSRKFETPQLTMFRPDNFYMAAQCPPLCKPRGHFRSIPRRTPHSHCQSTIRWGIVYNLPNSPEKVAVEDLCHNASNHHNARPHVTECPNITPLNNLRRRHTLNTAPLDRTQSPTRCWLSPTTWSMQKRIRLPYVAWI